MRSLLRKAARWTPLTFIAPQRYVERGQRWRDFEIRPWSWYEYEWESDGWSPYHDFAQRPSETVEKGTGDCEDYALVAASWALANERSPVRIGFCIEPGKVHPTHAICYDGNGWVFSSGSITYIGVERWLNESKYNRIAWRLVE